jgi:hypothetical protein
MPMQAFPLSVSHDYHYLHYREIFVTSMLDTFVQLAPFQLTPYFGSSTHYWTAYP